MRTGWLIACGRALRAALFLLLPWAAQGEIRLHLPESGPIAYQHVLRTNPNWSIHIVHIDLNAPGVSVAIARGGPDPDGDGPWTTTLLPTSEIARRENFNVAINGDFFAVPSTNEPGGEVTGYARGKFARVNGWAMSDGNLWQSTPRRRPQLVISATNTAHIVEAGNTERLTSARQIVSGHPIVVRHGSIVPHQGAFAGARHPRTAVGVNQTGHRLTLLVVDGRQPALSVGMTLSELSAELLSLGCWDGLNLDGGGSSTLVWRESSTQPPRILNSTSGGRERPVANVIGVRLDASTPTPASPSSPSSPEPRHP